MGNSRNWTTVVLLLVMKLEQAASDQLTMAVNVIETDSRRRKS